MTTHLSFPWVQYGYAVLGILISVVLPILRKQLPTITGIIPTIPQSIGVYAAVGTFSLLTAVLIVAFGGEAVPAWQWYTAILAGYAWDSTLQKIVHG